MKKYKKPFSCNLSSVQGVAPAPFALGVLAGKAAAAAVVAGAAVAGAKAAKAMASDNIYDMRKSNSLVAIG